jgi:NADH dehydrogenase [ubiquinone] 1 alpha subcomplex assembly factor 1|tara:strand:- start:35 stop:613 length:579 start_codon:yes stop_codon:yes gene_type:complete
VLLKKKSVVSLNKKMRILLFVTLFLVTSMEAQTVFNFSKNAQLNNWYVVDDGVMGGRSKGSMKQDQDGHGVFAGQISLKNNGGFSSLRYRLPEPISILGATQVVLKIKADGKDYQFRVTDQIGKRYSYITTFTTNGSWQEIVIPLNSLYPSFRGRSLNMPNFSGDVLQEITFLIGNKKEEDFELLIDSITLR